MEVDSLRSSVQTEEAAVYCMLYLSLSQIRPVAPCAVPSARKQKTNGGFMQYPIQLAVCPGWKRHQGAAILLGGAGGNQPEHHQMVEPRHHLLLPNSGLVVHLRPI